MAATQNATPYYTVLLVSNLVRSVSNLEINFKKLQNNLESGNSLYLKRIRRILGLYKQRDNKIDTPKESRIS